MRVRAFPATLFVLLIQGYQRVISPWTAASCRYYPSCSQYAVEALKGHGVLHGGWLAARRLGRCHPWTAGGVDHVPPRDGAPAGTVASPVTSTLTGV
jgi:putative membrane protein insertion efficiency factor